MTLLMSIANFFMSITNFFIENSQQLLKIFSKKSLIRLAYERVLPLVDKNQIFIATNEIQVPALKEDLIKLDDSRIIIEPAFRDTAAAIAYGSTMISKYYENPKIINYSCI